MRITSYTTATANNFSALDDKVNGMIEMGHQPFGSPYLTDTPIEGKVDSFVVAQAMVIYTNE